MAKIGIWREFLFTVEYDYQPYEPTDRHGGYSEATVTVTSVFWNGVDVTSIAMGDKETADNFYDAALDHALDNAGREQW
jgi:hypothetical protein